MLSLNCCSSEFRKDPGIGNSNDVELSSIDTGIVSIILWDGLLLLLRLMDLWTITPFTSLTGVGNVFGGSSIGSSVNVSSTFRLRHCTLWVLKVILAVVSAIVLLCCSPYLGKDWNSDI